MPRGPSVWLGCTEPYIALQTAHFWEQLTEAENPWGGSPVWCCWGPEWGPALCLYARSGGYKLVALVIRQLDAGCRNVPTTCHLEAVAEVFPVVGGISPFS